MRILGILVLAMLGVGGLMATACGGFFGIAGILEALSGNHSGGGENFGDVGMIIGIPSFVFGLAVSIGCFKGISRMSKRDATEAAKTQTPPKTPGEQ